jgi:hypothetical protein
MARQLNLASRSSRKAGSLNLDEGGCHLEIHRYGDSVVFRRLELHEFEFRPALTEGRSLHAAAHLVLERDQMFDLAMELRRLPGKGLISAFNFGFRQLKPKRTSTCC